METELTLRLDDRLIESAKAEAKKRGTSLSQLVADYLRKISSPEKTTAGLPPLTASLMGVLKGNELDRAEYRRHLEEKHD